MKTISIENAKQLQELGVSKDSTFSHCWFSGVRPDGLDGAYVVLVVESRHIHPLYQSIANDGTEYVAHAYTACELGEMLPDMFGGFGERNGAQWLTIQKVGLWECGYSGGDRDLKSRESKSIADAMALMLIWLLENGRVTVEEVNR